MRDLEFYEELKGIMEKYNQSDWNEPLDGDEVDLLVDHLKNQLNLMNGNITDDEYLQLEENYYNR